MNHIDIGQKPHRPQTKTATSNKGMSVRAAAAGIIAAEFSAVHYWQSAAAQPLVAAAGSSAAVSGDAVVSLMLINEVIIPSSTTMWLISSFCVVPLYQLTRFRQLQCLIRPNKTFPCFTVFSNYDHKSADNICLQLLAADCQERPLRNSHSAVCQRQPISVSSCADWHTLSYILSFTSFFHIVTVLHYALPV